MTDPAQLGTDAIRLHPADTVATVLRAVAAGETLRVGGDGKLTLLVATDSVPLCHKISLHPIEEGQAVIKYGHNIGDATSRIEAGQHVHVHNLRSARARAAA